MEAEPAKAGTPNPGPAKAGTPNAEPAKAGTPNAEAAEAGTPNTETGSRENQRAAWGVKNDLAKKGVTVLSAGADEVPNAYKRIEDVMLAQQDLVEVVARFDPKIVKMCDDGSAAED